jgi:NAD(P)-dependent dehydrogenase (short-subunit alcohol dehydrogenase family)
MKNILITGATSGIGKGLVEAYHESSHVYACGRNTEVLSAYRKLANVTSLQFDVTDLDDIERATASVDGIDILVLNAGNCEYIDDAVNFDSALFERVIRVNLLSVGYCLDVLLKKVNPGGQLVIVSSSAAFLPLPRAQAYGASKAAVTYLAKTLAVDLKGIDVSVVHPGFVKTPLTDKNDFPMPMAVTVDKAAYYIKKGIEKRHKDIHFPKRFTTIMKLFQLLPFGMWRGIAKGLSR